MACRNTRMASIRWEGRTSGEAILPWDEAMKLTKELHGCKKVVIVPLGPPLDKPRPSKGNS